jgi:hypothetical protein
LQRVREYGLTDDIDESDGQDFSLRSDQKPQVHVMEQLLCFTLALMAAAGVVS